MRRTTALVLAIIVGAYTWMLAEPAHAAPAPPVLSALDGSVPGVLTGTATSPGAPYLNVWISSDQFGYADYWTQLAADTDTFSVSTWGHGGARQVRAQACSRPSGDCSEPSAPITVTIADSRPSVAFSSDTKVGPNESPITLIVGDDDLGGGTLRSRWSNAYQSSTTDVAREGTTEVPPRDPQGAGTLEIVRCDTQGLYCASFSPRIIKSYTRFTELPLFRTGGVTRYVNSQTPVVRADLTAGLPNGPALSGTYTVKWSLHDLHGTTSGTLGPGGTLAPIQVDTSSLPESPTSPWTTSYPWIIEVGVDDPDFGVFTARSNTDPENNTGVVVDRTAPVGLVASVSNKLIYPNVRANLAYPHQTMIEVSDVPGGQDVRAVRIKSPDGKTVRTVDALRWSWNGRSATNVVVPGGTYEVVGVDLAGNESATVATIRVDPRRVVQRTWKRTVTPKASLVGRYVGRCSTLKQPSARRWAGSFGFNANTRCRTRTWRASAVSTSHRIVVPRAHEYTGVKVDAYGGAAPGHGKSLAAIRYLTVKNNEWAGDTVMRSFLGNHPGRWMGKNMVRPDRSVVWGAYTFDRFRYDVKTFTVTIHYNVLI